MSETLRGVLFDLDGTLLDTAPDMYRALERLMLEQELEPLPFPAVRDHVSHGSQALVQLGFPDADPVMRETLKRRYLEIYADNLCLETALFPGLAEVLAEMEERGLRLGVVTNKPAWLTQPLMDALQLTSRFATIISGDTLPQRKPAPEPMWLAAAQAGIPPDRIVYLGDAERDIAAGRAAGMRTLVADWGYIHTNEDPDTWRADARLQVPADFWSWLESLANADQCLAS